MSTIPPRTILMFPGQGAQYYQMGRELYEHDPAYRAAMHRCDAACGLLSGPLGGPLGGQPVSQLILDRPMSDSDGFDRQLDATASLLAVGYSLAQALLARELRPDVLLGYSFGETIAATVAGIFTLEDAFRLVHANARIIEATLTPGIMLAVLGDWETLRRQPEFTPCELAAVNSPRHFVVSLPPAALPPLTALLERREVAFARLPVRYGFHASFIDAAGPELRALAATIPRHPARYPRVSAMTGGPLDGLPPDHLWHVARQPIRFAETVRALAAAGPCRFIEAGPTGTLATFVKQILGPKADALPAINQFGHNLKTMAQIFP